MTTGKGHRLHSPPQPTEPSASGQWRNVAFIALAELLAMGLWFSASAVVPQLTAAWQLTESQQSWITMSVQLGFVAGALLSALLNLADRIAPQRLVAASALVGALANAAIPYFAPPLGVTFALRFLTGAALAGVYPPGMKLMATWCTRQRGLAIGILVGAITIGSASPHLLGAVSQAGFGGIPPWRAVLWSTSGMAALAALITLLLVKPGPHHSEPAPFDWRYASRALADRATRLANFGYLGHMWELYAMWVWVPLFLLVSFEQSGVDARLARLAGFGAIAAGGLGSLVAGRLADRLGRTTVTIWSLVISGSCCIIAGALATFPFALALLCLIWGFAVVADSAQFSTAVSELSDRRYVGTALTLQTCLGFLLTLITIRLIPSLVARVGWEFAFFALVPGPVFGAVSMWRLRRLPEAARMASGNR
jgi:MFS family permease